MRRIIYLVFVIFSMFIIPIKNAYSQDEYILHNIKKSDAKAFTQGLELNGKGDLILATGQYGNSSIGILDPNTGQYDRVDYLDSSYFGEGITFTDEALWQLTWKEETVFKRDPQSLNIIDKYYYEGEGWGLAYDPEQDVIWMSNGSDIIQQRSAGNFELLDSIAVKLDGRAVENINELEYANGYLYANVWYTNKIIAINLSTGEIDYQYDMTTLLTDNLTANQMNSMDTLNGIAHIQGDRFYITGKYYPVLFEVELLR